MIDLLPSIWLQFFTTKPYACEPSSLPKYPPSKEIDVKLREAAARRLAFMLHFSSISSRKEAGFYVILTPAVGWNMKVCVVMAVAQLLIWAIWAGISRHPSRRKVWLVVIRGGLAMLLEIYDFPPYQGFIDAHALWHATTVPIAYIWWSFIRDDAKYRTSVHVKKVK